MFVDYVMNGQGFGEVGEQLSGCRYDPGLLRPYVGKNGRKYVTVNSGKIGDDGKPVYEARLVTDMMNAGIPIPVANATSLRKDEWIELDRVVIKAARQRLRAWTDLEGASSFGGFNGMAKMILEHETMSDPGSAVVDMDALTPGHNDSPLFQPEGLPLPITHSDFWFSSRRLAVSRNTGTPLDTTMAEAAGRRVAEMIEKTLIGVETGVTYGTATNYSRTPSVYGYLNFPNRITKTNVTTPTGSNPAATVADVIAMRELAYAANYYGPFMLYHSPDWDAYLDNDYYALATTGMASPSQTLRQRLQAIEGITAVRRLDFLSTQTFTLILVQMTSDVARAVNGMELTTVQWETMGGMRVNFKVMCIKVPQLRADYNGNTGLVVGTTS